MGGPPTRDGAAPSLDEIIQADRKKRKEKQKYEDLAQSILGGGKRLSAPGAVRKPMTGPGASLASRMGVTKRSSSTTPKPTSDGPWRHDLHHVNNPRVPRGGMLQRTASASQLERGNRLYNSLQKNEQDPTKVSPLNGPGMSIKGVAGGGPYVVVASNFAPGTSAADIEAAMEPVGGAMTSCRILSAAPTVMAEMVFAEKAGAENVIATFNNQKADGRLLYVYMKQGGPTPIFAKTPTGPSSMVARSANVKPPPTAPRVDRDLMEVDDGPQVSKANPRRAEPAYEDGRYGFSDSYGRGDRGDYRRNRDPRGLYSDGFRSYRP